MTTDDTSNIATVCVTEPVAATKYLTAERVRWHQNKISSGIAEAACRSHFEALGFSVESFGIEHIAPRYYSTKDGVHDFGKYGKQFKTTLQKMPDFLVSRCHPHTPNIAEMEASGQLDAFLVDAKYRSKVVLIDFNKEIMKTYEEILNRDMHFFIYLVGKDSRIYPHSPRKQFKVGGKARDVYVHLGYFPGKAALQGEAVWWSVGETKLRALPICQGMDNDDDFSTVYAKVVHPVLAELLGEPPSPTNAKKKLFPRSTKTGDETQAS